MFQMELVNAPIWIRNLVLVNLVNAPDGARERLCFELYSSHFDTYQIPYQYILNGLSKSNTVRTRFETFECNGVNTCLLVPSMSPSGLVNVHTLYIISAIKNAEQNCPALKCNPNRMLFHIRIVMMYQQ